MVKALSVHTYVTFVHKKCYDYKDDWIPDTLATRGRDHAEVWDQRIHVPCPLTCGGIRFVAHQWRGHGDNPRDLLLGVTIVKEPLRMIREITSSGVETVEDNFANSRDEESNCGIALPDE